MVSVSETISVAIGQGPLIVTPLQVANMMAAIANGGNVYRPHVVRMIEQTAPDGKYASEGCQRGPARGEARHPALHDRVKLGLWKVVNEEGGTGGNARIAGLDISGKTGTVQVIAQHGWVKTEGLPFRSKDHAWFASFAPKDNPQMVVVVFVEHGGHGGTDAAPLAKMLYESRFKDQVNERPSRSEQPRHDRADQGRRAAVARKNESMIRERTIPTLDWNFIGTALVIAAVGCVLIYSATYFNDPGLSIFKKQLLWMGIGIALMILFIFVDYHVLFDIAPILYGIGIVLLIYLLVWGKVTANVKSWIHIGGFQFQPAEFMKVFTALMLAKFFDSNDRAYLNFRSFMYAMGIIALPVGLIIVQPDFGTAATFFPLVAVAMFFGGIRLRVWVVMVLGVLLIAPVAWFRFLKPYQRERVAIFLNPERDPLGTGYQVTQAKIAIGSGGIHGKGFQAGDAGQARISPRPSHRLHLRRPRRRVGIHRRRHRSGALPLSDRAGVDVRQARARSRRHIPVICLISFIIFHVFINVSMQIGVLPTTGIPLPLISYGGSSTMMFMIAIGLIANVDMRRFVNA